MPDYKISIVSYLNSKPFLRGIQQSELMDKIELSLDIPSVCAGKLIAGSVDIGLIPVAVIPQLNEPYIISDFCISADGPVDSVFLFANQPLEQLTDIWLDKHSRTSNNLTKVLAENYWNIEVRYHEREEDIVSLKVNEGMVLIGDRTFSTKGNYKYVYDLAQEWKKFTGKPFVFAAWVANKPVASEFLGQFNAALRNGVDQIQQVIDTEQRNDFDVSYYLRENLNFQLNAEKREVISLFLSYCAAL